MLYILLAAFSILAFSLILRSVSMTITVGVSGPFSAQGKLVATDNVLIEANPTVLAAQPATLTTRTNNTSGSLTMTNSGHGIITGQRIDLYWSGGRAYGAVAGTVSGTTVPIASVSGGSNLPIATTPICVGICKSCPFNLTGDNVQAFACFSPVDSYFVFSTNSADVYGAFVTATEILTWITGLPGAATNPLAGATPTKIWMSHADTTESVLKMQAAAVTH